VRVVHVPQALVEGVSHELQELDRVWLPPVHTLFEEKIVSLKLLKFTRHQVGCLHVLRRPTEVGDDDGLVSEGGFHGAHPDAL
jgi:hypothetical protein